MGVDAVERYKEEFTIILKTAAERLKNVQAIDVHRKIKNGVVTLLVMSYFSIFLGG